MEAKYDFARKYREQILSGSLPDLWIDSPSGFERSREDAAFERGDG